MITGSDAKRGAEMTYQTRYAYIGAVAEIDRAYATASEDRKSLYHPFLIRQACPACVENLREPDPLAALVTALAESGLGYLTLDQSSTAMSGGEAQRIKLARAALRGRHGPEPGLLILDEPITGLHPEDAQRLMATLDLLIERGNTIVIAEHDIHAAASADWIIDLGPGAGEAGGRIINAGPPAQVAAGS